MKYGLQTRILGILSCFYERKGKFYSCDHYEILSPLDNYIYHVNGHRQWEIVQKLFYLKLETDLNTEAEKLCEHGPDDFLSIKLLFVY